MHYLLFNAEQCILKFSENCQKIIFILFYFSHSLVCDNRMNLYCLTILFVNITNRIW